MVKQRRMMLRNETHQAQRPRLQLAPMEGVLDWILRELLSRVGGVDRMVTEFVRVTDRLLPEHVFLKYCPELGNGGRTKYGTPVFVQLLGGQPGPMGENAARVAEMGAPGIDLNFGCPAKTVNRHDGGAALLKNPERIYQVVSAVRRAVPAHIPVTAKVRLGFEDTSLHKEIGAAAESGGADHLVVHARTKLQMYQPPAHWHLIASLAEGRTFPVLANGDIWSVDDFRRCALESGRDSFALGRGLVRRPTLAIEIKRAMGFDVPDECFEFDRLQFLRNFFAMSLAYRGEAFAVARMKQLARYWSAEGPEWLAWFDRVKRVSKEEEVLASLSPFAPAEALTSSSINLESAHGH